MQTKTKNKSALQKKSNPQNQNSSFFNPQGSFFSAAQTKKEGATPVQRKKSFFTTQQKPAEQVGAPLIQKQEAPDAGTKTGTINASALNIRKGPGANHGKTGKTIKGGETITILTTAENGWHKIGPEQWVSGKYVKINPQKEKPKPEKQEGPDLDVIADQVHGAMAGIGTNESQVYSNLDKLKKDPNLIIAFKKLYLAKYKKDIIAHIKSEFSNTLLFGNQLDKALGYLNINDAKDKSDLPEKEKAKVSKEAEGLKKLVDAGKETHPDKSAKVKALAKYAREQYATYPPKIKAFKDQKNLTADQKVAIMGKLAVEVAKMEYYMGTVFHAGGEWETSKGNKGEFVDHYTKQSSYDGKRVAAPWCTKFATYTKSAVLGLRGSHSNDGESRRGVWGGSQLSNGYENFWDYNKDKGGRFVGQKKKGQSNEWATLTKDVGAKKTKAEKITTVKAFFNKHFWPQAGDIMITGDTKNSFKYSKHKNFDASHTTLVEKVDVTDDHAYIYTIEGNAGNMVTGKRYDLTANSGKTGVNKIVNISRFSMDNYGKSTSVGDKKEIKALAKPQKYDEKTLLKPLQEMTALLKDYAVEEKAVKNSSGTIYDQVKKAAADTDR